MATAGNDRNAPPLGPFPDSPRVIYERNPLEEVICQLRFPPLLRIEAELPADFQDAIRSTFPLLRETRSVELPVGMPPEVAELLSRAVSPRSAYQFLASDERFSLALTRDFLALTAKKYRRWEEFRELLIVALDGLRAVYAPDAFTRVGLRYRDVICRSDVGMAGAPWTFLLQPHVAAELSDNAVGASVEEAKRELLVGLPLGKAKLRHGFGQKEGGETCYIIDIDFFIEGKIEVSHAIEALDVFHRQAGRAFRWCISRELHDALGPQPA